MAGFLAAIVFRTPDQVTRLSDPEPVAVLEPQILVGFGLCGDYKIRIKVIADVSGAELFVYAEV